MCRFAAIGFGGGRGRWRGVIWKQKTKITNNKNEKMKKNKGWIIAGVVILALVLWGVSGYNSLVGMDEEVNGKWANVETQYQRRSDLLPNLVSTVKG